MLIMVLQNIIWASETKDRLIVNYIVGETKRLTLRIAGGLCNLVNKMEMTAYANHCTIVNSR